MLITTQLRSSLKLICATFTVLDKCTFADGKMVTFFFTISFSLLKWNVMKLLHNAYYPKFISISNLKKQGHHISPIYTFPILSLLHWNWVNFYVGFYLYPSFNIWFIIIINIKYTNAMYLLCFSCVLMF